ncbi:DUF4922 domain-containing protein [Carboxylicivirga sediminis]|uniref:DUF4922 domain-containing protein n=1 Tax=Carboxylicivirga sediminis TaxID=2006564 RepID=A0A941IVY3_9BACT|nr:DUF4922 domain-containing protein [Carboxylicivirga sediminis]MBR8533999.1 DUF4922 domain-containing protein [Carboxylicivirga sediminis]
MTTSLKTKKLIQGQLCDWSLATNNYAGLQKVKTKSVQLDGGSEIKVQFNPERIRSSAAKVDTKSIQERPCFLCEENRPAEQEGVDYGDYTILINPFPIFTEHLTIPNKEHTLQLIAPYFPSMLELANELDEFTLFYNGPKCGASAPDHFHFQAGIKGFMPLEADFRGKRFAQLHATHNGVEVYNWAGYNRGVITFKGSDKEAIESLFGKLHKMLADSQPDEVEPMLNVLAYFEEGQYVVHVFPRILHRPACYFAEGDEQILISPASVDMGGVFITPRPEDFEKIGGKDVVDILKQVCLSEEACGELLNQLMAK